MKKKIVSILGRRDKRVKIPKELLEYAKILNTLATAQRKLRKLSHTIKPLGSIIVQAKKDKNSGLMFNLGNFLTEIDLGMEAGRFFYEAAYEIEEKKKSNKA